MKICRQPLASVLFLCLGIPVIHAADATDTQLEVSRLTRRLTTSSSPLVRLAAIGKLAALDVHDSTVIRALCQAMLDPVPEVRSRAGSLLEKIAADIYWPVRSLT